MAIVAPQPKFTAYTLDVDGFVVPLVGGRLYSYIPGTSTPKSTYTDSTLGSANTNPVVLDANGQANVWFDGATKLVLKNSSDVTQWTVDALTDLSKSGVLADATLNGTLTISSTAVTWSGNPTHSGNHTFTNNVVVNGNTTLGNSSADTLTIAPNATTWSNNPTHSGNHTWSGSNTFSGGIANTTVTWSGNPTHSGTHTWSGAQTFSADPAGRILGSTYTPTITNVANIDSSSVVGPWNYIRIGPMVIASGQINIDTTAAASTLTTFRLSLPVASNLANVYELTGVLQGGSSADALLGINGDATNNEAACTFASGATTNRTYHVWIMYKVI